MAAPKSTNIEEAYLKASAHVCGLARRHVAPERKAIDRSVQDVARRAFASGVQWAMSRKLSAKEKALVKAALTGGKR